MNILPQKEDGSYTYSSRMGGKLCLLLGAKISLSP